MLILRSCTLALMTMKSWRIESLAVVRCGIKQMMGLWLGDRVCVYQAD